MNINPLLATSVMPNMARIVRRSLRFITFLSVQPQKLALFLPVPFGVILGLSGPCHEVSTGLAVNERPLVHEKARQQVLITLQWVAGLF